MNALRLKKLFFVSGLSFLTSNAWAEEDVAIEDHLTSGYVISDATTKQPLSKIAIKSTILQEERELLIHLPDDYETSEAHYSVIYVLDGKRHILHAPMAYDILQQEALIPPAIIVGITNNRGTRSRDLLEQKRRFMDYISSEVIPLINKVYRTTEKNTLFGHSLAGYFTLNMLADMPTLFDNFIAASPVLQVNEAETLTKFQTFSISGNNEKSLYMTLTDEINEGADATRAMNDFVESLRVSKPDNLNWRYDFIPDQRHMTTPYLTLYKGLTNVFLSFQAPPIPDFEAFQAAGGIKGIDKYYVKRAEKYLVSSDIPERTLINIGFNILDSGHPEQGIELLTLITRRYPNSFRAMNALAMAYEEAEQRASALNVYKQALVKAEAQSSPASNHFKAQIERLDKQSN